VAGASGFIGQALGQSLSRRYKLTGLSRSGRPGGPHYTEFRKTDLFSLRESERGLREAEVAIYLVHSMLPAARLVQGHFSDLDILCADNFARAAAVNGVRHIIYIGGLLPQAGTLSHHLRSRLEVEHTLAQTGIPVTTLRAGMVVGPNGSSYQLLARLVERLPVMACPKWTRTRMQPIALGDLVGAVEQVLLQRPGQSRVFDVGAPDIVSYQELMQATAKSLGLKRRFIPVPLLSTRLSRLWVSLTTGAPKDLVAPLVQSLEHEMLAREHAPHRLEQRATTGVKDMLELAATQREVGPSVPRAFVKVKAPKGPSKVCSVQRMSLPEGRDAKWAVNTYFTWLPKALRGLVRVTESQERDEVIFSFRLTGQRLLGLKRLPHRSGDDRQVLKVTHGLLARESHRGRLEFRQALDGGTLIASIQDFVPRLPWWIYRPTQGLFHRWVMWRFKRHLKRCASSAKKKRLVGSSDHPCAGAP